MRNLPSAVRLVLASSLLLPAVAFAGDLRVAFIDVGQGDAEVVIAPSGCAAVIDGGPTGTGADIKAYLHSQGVTQIDFGICTHFHADHLGGLDEVAQGTDGIPFTRMYDRGGSYSSTAYTQYANQFAGIRQTVTRGQTFSLCNEVTFEVVSVNGNGVSLGGDENGASVGVKITYGAFNALIAGDLVGTGPAVEPTLIGNVGAVEVYKVHHHGSKYSSIDTFLAEIVPTVSVIEVGVGNTYGHPTPEAIARLQAVGSTIYQTEDPSTNRALGNVVVSTATGASYTVTQGGTSTTFSSQGGGGGGDTTPPTAPGALAANASGSSSIDLSWTASTDNVGVTGYRVYRSTNGNSFSLAGTTTTTGFADTGLSALTTYWYQVTALDAAGNESPASNTASATTLGTSDTQAPTAPAGLTATATSTSSISLSWTAATDNVGVADYLVYRSSNGSTFSQVGTATTTSWADSGLASATTYWYRVRAEDAAGNVSGDSNTASATTNSSSSPGKMILNEILANEAGSATGGEFVELVNAGGTAVDISGWKLYEGSTVRHTFASGTSIQPGKAIVVFASASYIPGGLTNAVAASTGSLGLVNTGTSVSLKNGKTKIDTYTYSSSLASVDGVSMNRNPDATAGAAMVLHTAISSLDNSPGEHADGTAF